MKTLIKKEWLDEGWLDVNKHLIVDALPKSMRYLLLLVPLVDVLKIISTYGGARVYIASRPKPNHALVKLIGMESAQAIAGSEGGLILEIPLAMKVQNKIRNYAILASLAQGVSQSKTARAFGVTERTVRNTKKAHLTTQGVN